MRGFWSETNWRLDGDALLMPNGWRIPLNATKKLRPDRPKFYATSAKKLMPSAPTANKLVQPEKLCLSFYATEALVLKFH